MLLRAITMAGGLAGAAGLSQFPEYSQQYVQRLGGAVDELSRFVAEFDADATAVGMTRQAALADLGQGGAMGARRAGTMAATIARHDRLRADLEELGRAGPFTRLYRAGHLGDAEIAAKAWAAYRPALPLTVEGASFAGLGFVAGMAGIGLVLSLLGRVFRRKRAAPELPVA